MADTPATPGRALRFKPGGAGPDTTGGVSLREPPPAAAPRPCQVRRPVFPLATTVANDPLRIAEQTHAPRGHGGCPVDFGASIRPTQDSSCDKLPWLPSRGTAFASTSARLAFLEILKDRWGKASTVMISQRFFATCHEAQGEPTIADAICDQLFSKSEKIKLKGESLRSRSMDQLELSSLMAYYYPGRTAP